MKKHNVARACMAIIRNIKPGRRLPSLEGSGVGTDTAKTPIVDYYVAWRNVTENAMRMLDAILT